MIVELSVAETRKEIERFCDPGPVILAERARGLITPYELLDGNSVDERHVLTSLERHKPTLGNVPKLYRSDRGFFSERNVMSCKQQGVKVACIPERSGAEARCL